jgi:hypothetical protein
MHAMTGTQQALADLMAWHGIEEPGEAMTLMIHHLHALARAAPYPIWIAPRNQSVARKLKQFRERKSIRINVDQLYTTLSKLCKRSEFRFFHVRASTHFEQDF